MEFVAAFVWVMGLFVSPLGVPKLPHSNLFVWLLYLPNLPRFSHVFYSNYTSSGGGVVGRLVAVGGEVERPRDVHLRSFSVLAHIAIRFTQKWSVGSVEKSLFMYSMIEIA